MPLFLRPALLAAPLQRCVIGVVVVIAFFFTPNNHSKRNNSGLPLLVDGGASSSKSEQLEILQKQQAEWHKKVLELIGIDDDVVWRSLPLTSLLNSSADNAVVEWSEIAEAPTKSLGALAEQCVLAALLLDVMHNVVQRSVSGTAPKGINVEKVLAEHHALLYKEYVEWWILVRRNHLLAHLAYFPIKAARVALLALLKRAVNQSIELKVIRYI